jgi:hypothetical protein
MGQKKYAPTTDFAFAIAYPNYFNGYGLQKKGKKY